MPSDEQFSQDTEDRKLSEHLQNTTAMFRHLFSKDICKSKIKTDQMLNLNVTSIVPCIKGIVHLKF